MSENLKRMLKDQKEIQRDVENPVLIHVLKQENSLDVATDLSLSPLEPSAAAALLRALYFHDPKTFRHSVRTAIYARLLAQWLKLGKEEGVEFTMSALLHDIGKIGIPYDLLNRPGDLTLQEFDAMKKHTQMGAEILGECCFHKKLLESVLHHHERMDGYGYPQGLAGEDIPFFSRMTLVVDTFDAMTSNRSYQSSLPVEDALQEIQKSSGTQFDPAVTEVFLGHMRALIAKIEDKLGISVLPRIKPKAA
jgi:putative nucleotidyltransferase with HDIG domain